MRGLQNPASLGPGYLRWAEKNKILISFMTGPIVIDMHMTGPVSTRGRFRNPGISIFEVQGQ